MSPLVFPGGTLELAYPALNRFGVPLEFVDRTVEVFAIEKYFDRPLPAEAFLQRPLVRRGWVLIHGYDLADRNAGLKRFWLQASKGPWTLPSYRLGLYDPLRSDRPVDWVGCVFRPNREDRLAMKAAIIHFLSLVQEHGPVGLRLGAFPVKDDAE